MQAKRPTHLAIPPLLSVSQIITGATAATLCMPGESYSYINSPKPSHTHIGGGEVLSALSREQTKTTGLWSRILPLVLIVLLVLS